MRAWLRRIKALVSSAVFAPILAKLGAATVFLTVLGLVGRGVFDPLGLAPGAARAGSSTHSIGAELLPPRQVPPPAETTLPHQVAPPPAPVASAGPPAASASASAAPAAPPAPTCPAGADGGAPRIILNAAGEADLTKLPGVGPKKAQAILALREKLGRFKRVEDLYRVRGIKRRFVDRVRPHLVLDAADCDRAGGGA